MGIIVNTMEEFQNRIFEHNRLEPIPWHCTAMLVQYCSTQFLAIVQNT